MGGWVEVKSPKFVSENTMPSLYGMFDHYRNIICSWKNENIFQFFHYWRLKSVGWVGGIHFLVQSLAPSLQIDLLK